MSDPVPHLEIRSIPGPATIQDGGRPGHLAQGIPVGGALCPDRLARANLAVGNHWAAPAIESFGPIAVRARGGALTLSLDGERILLGNDETVRLEKPRSRRLIYLAVAGAFDVPPRLGGRGTLAVASLGGFEGRMLRRGDLLPIGRDHGALDPAAAPGAGLGEDEPIRIVAGPDPERFAPEALARFCSDLYTISPASDRVGTRLEGPPIPRRGDDGGISLPMVRGAIQVARGGVPIVFGPDHPVTGGYPILAAVIRADWGRLEARPIGGEVRFRLVSIEAAREAWRRLPLQPS